jgi:hypothetical protein
MMDIENEHTFKQSLAQGINLFIGSGFSVLARDCEDRSLPIGRELASELIDIFKIPEITSLDLSKISTILEYDRKNDFYTYIKKRFAVKYFESRYSIIDKLNIKTIFTTNVDDLIYKIYASSHSHYLQDINLRGPAFNEREAIDFVALHGTIVDESRPMSFGSRDIAAAFSIDPDSWRFLTGRLRAFPTIFWGHGIEDAGVLEALNPYVGKGDLQKDRWLILHPSTEIGYIKYFKALDFHIITADTSQVLDYLSSLKIEPIEVTSALGVSTRDIFPQGSVPDVGTIPVRPIKEFWVFV